MILPTLAILLALDGAGLRPEQCDIKIVLDTDEFESSYSVQPRIRSSTLETIFLPQGKLSGYQVDKLASDTPLDGMSTRRVLHFPRREVLSRLPLEREVGDGTDLSLDWGQIATVTSERGFTVPAGIYRLRLVFSPYDFALVRAKTVELCDVHSPPFRILKDSSWTTFSSRQPNTRVNPSVRPVTARACARAAPVQPAGYAHR